MTDWLRESWMDAERRRVDSEKEAMSRVAPELVWIDSGAWVGLAPAWPFERPAPATLDAFLDGRRLRLRVTYPEAFPMVAPRVWPLDPEPDPRVRTQHDWHVNPDGSLCLVQASADWTGWETAADLVVKSSGWFIEYLLMEAGRVTAMTECGIVNDDVHDVLLESTSELTDPS